MAGHWPAAVWIDPPHRPGQCHRLVGRVRVHARSFHVGVFVKDGAEVDAVHRRLREDGFDVAAPERHLAHGFDVKAPGGFTVELGA